MPKAYSLIRAQTLTGTATSVTFDNIPQTFTDLMFVLSTRSDRSANYTDQILMSINSTTTGYSWRYLYANSNTMASGNGTTRYASEAGSALATASTFSNATIYIPNYTSSSFKTYSVDSVVESNTASISYNMTLEAGLWSNTAAITSISFAPEVGPNFLANSTFYLYGVGGARATGGTVTSDVNYTYHTFTSTATLTALEKISNVEVLCIAGGGGGGTSRGGGGGAGGVLYRTGQVLNAGTTYTAVVGAGGAAGGSPGAETGTNGGNGGDSTFASLVAIGGGGGQTSAVGTATPPAGGSGGGASLWNFSPGGLGTPGQGYNGGGSIGWNTSGSSGGGGGAGGTPPTSLSAKSGDGGPGTLSYAVWAAATNTGINGFYAGGGGGGADGSSMAPGAGQVGGGNGGVLAAGTAATANTGSGGGGGGRNSGSGTTYAGAAGGSGLIIIRYPN